MRDIPGTITEYVSDTPIREILWQDIDHHKPNHSGPVILTDAAGNFDFAWVTSINGKISFNISGSMEYQDVTHWAWALSTKL
jgi:hypothetical protein